VVAGEMELGIAELFHEHEEEYMNVKAVWIDTE
jgi:hypothetical protein